jgi:GNAT superfamily N-acetyltransferase
VSNAPRPELLVRRASVGDVEAVLALVPRLVAFGPPAWRDADEMTRTDRAVIVAALASETGDPVVYVAESGSGLAGFVHLHSQVDYFRRREHGHVADLVVAETYEGQGVASRLIAEAERWARARGYDWLTISVFEENARAAGLYGHLGFERDTVNLLKTLDR